jgi:dTDP-D-glucose 4,6-dehydratase
LSGIRTHDRSIRTAKTFYALDSAATVIGAYLNRVRKFSFFLTENQLLLRFKHKSTNEVQGTIADLSENRMKQVICWQNAEVLIVKQVVLMMASVV